MEDVDHEKIDETAGPKFPQLALLLPYERYTSAIGLGNIKALTNIQKGRIRRIKYANCY